MKSGEKGVEVFTEGDSSFLAVSFDGIPITILISLKKLLFA